MGNGHFKQPVRNLPAGFEQFQLPKKQSIREQLLRQIEIGERAKEALELLDTNPIIQNFLNKIE